MSVPACAPAAGQQQSGIGGPVMLRILLDAAGAHRDDTSGNMGADTREAGEDQPIIKPGGIDRERRPAAAWALPQARGG